MTRQIERSHEPAIQHFDDAVVEDPLGGGIQIAMDVAAARRWSVDRPFACRAVTKRARPDEALGAPTAPFSPGFSPRINPTETQAGVFGLSVVGNCGRVWMLESRETLGT